MTFDAVLKEVQFKLGRTEGMGSKIELNNKDLTMVISSSLRELSGFMDTPKFATVPFQDQIDISKLKLASVINIMRAETPAGGMEGVSLDPFYLSQGTRVTFPGQPNNNSILQTQAMYAIRAMAQNTVQDELSYMTDLYNQKLYVSYSGIKPNRITIIYRPVIESVEDLPSSEWVNYLIELAVAHGQIIIGMLRTKYTAPNAPYSVGAQILEQGNTGLAAVREKLERMKGPVFG